MDKQKNGRVATTAERLREARQDAGKKQVDLVNETGIERGAISRYLAGKYEPKQTAVTKLAKVLNVSEMWLFGYDVPKGRTLEQKKNDQLAQLIVRMRRDPAFYNIVEMLDQVPADQLENLGGLIAGLLK
jgi:transcriptional regulator with XRE-family HTH domain